MYILFLTVSFVGILVFLNLSILDVSPCCWDGGGGGSGGSKRPPPPPILPPGTEFVLLMVEERWARVAVSWTNTSAVSPATILSLVFLVFLVVYVEKWSTCSCW